MGHYFPPTGQGELYPNPRLCFESVCIDAMEACTRQVEFGTLAEQEDEAYYDDREDADDDMEKGRIKFPIGKLYGRDKELDKLFEIHRSMLSEASSRVVFLAGYSGTGKSTLVDTFIDQIQRSISNSNNSILYITGKFGQIRSGDPFSALSHALNQYVVQVTQTSSALELQSMRKRLSKVDISFGSHGAIVLEETLIPALGGLLQKEPEELIERAPPKRQGSVIHDMNVIKYSFKNFIKALATENKTVALFIDDLQWADEDSLQLVLALLLDKSLKHLLFIGAYRPNELEEDHEVSKMMKKVEQEREPEFALRMEIFNLSPGSIADFIADSIDRTPEEVGLVAEVVYKKTLGNIFFVKQALDELVRKNALYYDVVMFQWQFGDVSRVELECFLSEDVLEMVQSKIHTLPDILQKALVVAAFIDNTMELELLAALLAAESVALDVKELQKMMNRAAFVEGLMLRSEISVPSGSDIQGYKFAHDRIREAACASVPYGERDHLLLRISMVLLDRAASGGDDWMLFAAARHLNSLPFSLTDPMQLPKLNLTVGGKAFSKGAFNEAVVFLRAGVDRLNSESCWRDQYELSLDLKTLLAETEQLLGNNDNALEIAQDIFGNAKSLVEKSRAHYCFILATNEINDKNYGQSTDAALAVLKMYNINLPSSPTSSQVKREKFCLNIGLRGRSLVCLANFPIATDEMQIAQMKIAVKTLTFASFSGRSNLALMLGYRMLRIALANKTITKELPSLLSSLAWNKKEKGKYNSTFLFANAAIALMERFPGEKAPGFLRAKMALHGALLGLRVSYRDDIEAQLELHKSLRACGETDFSLSAGMVAMLEFLEAGLPVNALFEPKLMLFEEVSSNLGSKTHVVIFRVIRQCLYNLQGGDKSSSVPSEINGSCCSEDEALALFDGPSRKMTFRDISIIRLMLAVIYDDEATMIQMLDRLDEYPIHDLCIVRQHLRMTYVGLASLLLKQKKSTGMHEKWAKTSMKFFEDLSRFGSPNAQPVHACMKALNRPNVPAFDEAIQICANAGLLNLAALMKERCGLMLLEDYVDGKCEAPLHERYLKCAIWFYHDWGATGKVSELTSRFDFLRDAMQEKPPSQLSTMRRQVAALGVSRTSSSMISDT